MKGAASKSRKCSLCRQVIPGNFFNHPTLESSSEESSKEPKETEVFEWFYEGRNGWWQYDPRTSVELEEAFNKEVTKKHTILVAGFLYEIDFQSMIQFRQNDPNRQRKIKRDLSTIAKKGIAGLRLTSEVKLDEPVNLPSGSNEPVVSLQETEIGEEVSETLELVRNEVEDLSPLVEAALIISEETS